MTRLIIDSPICHAKMLESQPSYAALSNMFPSTRQKARDIFLRNHGFVELEGVVPFHHDFIFLDFIFRSIKPPEKVEFGGCKVICGEVGDENDIAEMLMLYSQLPTVHCYM